MSEVDTYKTLTDMLPAQETKIVHEAGPQQEGGKQLCRRCGASVVFSPWPLLREGSLVEMTTTGRVLYHQIPQQGAFRMCQDA